MIYKNSTRPISNKAYANANSVKTQRMGSQNRPPSSFVNCTIAADAKTEIQFLSVLKFINICLVHILNKVYLNLLLDCHGSFVTIFLFICLRKSSMAYRFITIESYRMYFRYSFYYIR